MVIVLVSGPPCAGKSTYVAQHARAGDVVLDRDVMGGEAYEAAVRALPASTAPRTWVIRCLPGEHVREQYARLIGAHEHVHVVAHESVLMERARARLMPHRHVAAVRAWLDREAGRAALTSVRDPEPAIAGWWA